MDDTTRLALLEAAQAELSALLERLVGPAPLALAEAEREVRATVQAVGARLLEGAVALGGTGRSGPWQPCGCGGAARYRGERGRDVQTLVGWIRVRRAYYHCPGCRRGWCPLDRALGIGRDSHGPGVRALAVRLGALLPFAPAAAVLAETTGATVSAATVRTLTEAAGRRRDGAVSAAVAQAWQHGAPPAAGPAPARLVVAMDGVRILGRDGGGREVKVGVVRPLAADGRPAGAASYAAGLEPAAAFGRRLALEAHRRGLEGAAEVAVLGDGAAWIWALAAEHFPGAVAIVDWYHASERVWALARALHGEGTPAAAAWAARQLDRLAAGEAARLAAEWRRLPCRGEAAAVRDEQATYFANQAPRMAYHRYRAAGWDIGSGVVESACKHLIGAREKGPGMRWSDAGAHAVAQVRVLHFNDQWDQLWAA